eukprot:PhF_6_TR37801/c0_g1_i1/m.56282
MPPKFGRGPKRDQRKPPPNHSSNHSGTTAPPSGNGIAFWITDTTSPANCKGFQWFIDSYRLLVDDTYEFGGNFRALYALAAGQEGRSPITDFRLYYRKASAKGMLAPWFDENRIVDYGRSCLHYAIEADDFEKHGDVAQQKVFMRLFASDVEADDANIPHLFNLTGEDETTLFPPEPFRLKPSTIAYVVIEVFLVCAMCANANKCKVPRSYMFPLDGAEVCLVAGAVLQGYHFWVALKAIIPNDHVTDTEKDISRKIVIWYLVGTVVFLLAVWFGTCYTEGVVAVAKLVLTSLIAYVGLQILLDALVI